MEARPAMGWREIAGTLMERQVWSRDRLEAHQRVALRELLEHAVTRSPYYRDALGAESPAEDVRLEDLPTLPKETLMAEWDRVVTDPRVRLEGVERHLLHEEPGSLYLGEFRALVTGGATGRRGVFVYGADEFETSIATNVRAVAVAGARPEMRVAPIGSPSPLHLTNHVFAALRAGRAGSPRLDITMPLAELVERLNVYQPDAIAGYPSILRQLAEEQAAGRLQIDLRIAAVGSEVLTDETRERVRDVWGISVRDVYASTEGANMASECPASAGLHVWEDCTLLEVVDERNRPVAPGSPGDKVLLTVLWSRTLPLVRYELKDSVTLAAGPNPTGRPFARIASVDGRTADILRLPARGGGEVAVHPIHLRTPFTRFPDVLQYQLQRSNGGLLVRVVLRPAAPRDVLTQVGSSLEQALEHAGAVPPPVAVEPVDAIPRTGSGAKLTLLAPETEPALAG